MSTEKVYDITGIILMISIISLIIFGCYVEYTRLERLEMYGVVSAAPLPFSYENGIYSSDKYYCVWTGSKNYNDIQKTEIHEQCHSLIDNDYHHFCEEWKK